MKLRNAVGLCGTLLASGCGSDPAPPVVVAGDGLLTVDWTIDRAKDPYACRDEAADSIDVYVSTPGGTPVGDFNEYCESFAMSISLAPGTYFADATLLDAGGAEITTPVDLGRFTLYGDDELVVPIDFPYDSFY